MIHPTSASSWGNAMVFDMALDRPDVPRLKVAQLTLQADLEVLVNIGEVLLELERTRFAGILAEITLQKRENRVTLKMK